MQLNIKEVFGRGVCGAGWKNAGICLFLAAAVFFTSKIYALLNHGPAVLHLRTPIDAALPLVPVFVIPYNTLEPLIYLSLMIFLLCRADAFKSACLALLTAWFVSYGFYFFLQTEDIRPVLTGVDAFTPMIRAVYAGDNRFNDFPSLHTALSSIIAIHWLQIKRNPGIAVAVWVSLIVASTVLIKQHYVADLLAGLVLAFAVSTLWIRLIIKPRPVVVGERFQ